MVDLEVILNYASIRFSAMDSLLKHCNSVKMGYLLMVMINQSSVP